jgi:Mrp family chromosome partitioning ATPase
VPRQAAGHYAGYADVSAKLENCLLKQQSKDEQIVCVLSGMGGVGKSESVLQFLKKHDTALRER